MNEEGGSAPSEPLYARVYNTLRAEILAGKYTAGDLLPSEAALVNRFGVSRHTVREALRHLKDVELVSSRKGSGTLVLQAAPPHQYVYRLNSVADMHDQLVATRYDKGVAPVTIDRELLERFEVEESEGWLGVSGLRYPIGENEPICDFEVQIAPQFTDVVRHGLDGTRPVYSLIEAHFAVRIDDVHQLVSAFRADERRGARIGMVPGETGIEIRRIFRLSTGSLCMFSFNYYPADRFVISMNLQRVK